MYVWQPNQCSWRWGPSPQHRPHCIVLLLQVKASCSRCPTQQFHSGTTLPSVYLDFVPSFCLVPVTLQFSLKYSQCQYRSMSVSLLEYTSRLDENLRSCSRLNFSISRMIHTVHGIFVKMSESWNGWNSQASRSSSLTNSLFSTHSSQNQIAPQALPPVWQRPSGSTKELYPWNKQSTTQTNTAVKVLLERLSVTAWLDHGSLVVATTDRRSLGLVSVEGLFSTDDLRPVIMEVRGYVYPDRSQLSPLWQLYARYGPAFSEAHLDSSAHT